MNKRIEWALGFWVSFAVAYCVMRWAFEVGHLAAALAYIETQVAAVSVRLRRKASA